MIGEVLFKAHGKTHFAFCYDAEGNLLRLSAKGNPVALIPYAVRIESTVHDLVHPTPWTISAAKVMERLCFLPLGMIAGTEAERALQTGEFPQVQYPFVPPSEFADDDEQIEAAIQLWESLADGHEMKATIETAMVASGLSRITRLPNYCESVHIQTKPSDTFEVVSDGWMSNTKVFRKSVVRGG